jgi:hypothetical protein
MITSLLSLILAAPAPPVDHGIAVLDIKAVHGVSDGVAEMLTETLLVSLRDTGAFSSVMGGSDLRATLDLEQAKAAVGCNDNSCLAELGGALGVPFLAHVSIGKLGDEFVLTLKVISVEEAKVLGRAMRTASKEAQLLKLIAELAKEAAKVSDSGAVKTAPPLQETPKRAVAVDQPGPAPATAKGSKGKVLRYTGLGTTAVGLGLGGLYFASRGAAHAGPNWLQAGLADAVVVTGVVLYVMGQ